MKLVEVQVVKCKNILDSSPLKVQPKITALVGKNESGKSDHGRPADVFLRDKVNFLAALGADKLDRFESLFKQATSTLPK